MGRVSFFIENWKSGVDIHKLKKNIDNKKVYLLGDQRDSETIKSFLVENEIEMQGIIAIEDLEKIISDEKPYLILKSAYDGKLLNKLHYLGYYGEKDMHVIWRDTTITSVAGYYCDECGNEIICEDRFSGLEVNFQGYNNKLYIGKDFYAEGVKIKMKGGASLHFGPDMGMVAGRMYLKNSVTRFEGDAWLGSDFFISNFDGDMKVGKGFSGLNGLYMCCVENTKLTIGEDCMFAKNVKILSGAAHSLFDLTEKININIRDDVHVNIGDHVWVGMDSAVIYNSDIGNNSMVGAMSLVKGTYPDHVVIAGNIARVVRENIDWDFRDYMTYPEYEEMMAEREKAKNKK